MPRTKHRKDYNHVSGGMQSGNIRYKRKRRNARHGDKTMGKWSGSRA